MGRGKVQIFLTLFTSEVDTIEDSVDKVPYDGGANVTVDTVGSEHSQQDISSG